MSSVSGSCYKASCLYNHKNSPRKKKVFKNFRHSKHEICHKMNIKYFFNTFKFHLLISWRAYLFPPTSFEIKMWLLWCDKFFTSLSFDVNKLLKLPTFITTLTNTNTKYNHQKKGKSSNLCTQFITHTRRFWKTCNVRFLFLLFHLCFIYLNNSLCSKFWKAHKIIPENIRMNDKMFVGWLYFSMMIANGLWSSKYTANKQQQKKKLIALSWTINST